MNFTKEDAQTLLNIMKSRRDVRGNRFLPTPIEKEKLQLILESAITAPSVGYSQPWKFVIIDNQEVKESIAQNFTQENNKAKEIFKESSLYKTLKLEGIKEAPINIAVIYTKSDTPVLGMTSMSKMGEYSVVCAVENMWLMSRTLGIGMGWVSILDEKEVLKTLNAPLNTQLIAYLCLGYVDEFYKEPELKTLKWKEEKKLTDVIVKNGWSNKGKIEL